MKILLTLLTALTALNTAGVAYLLLRGGELSLATESQPIPFHDRSIREKISQATVIFTVRYEANDEKMISIVDQILKKEDGVEFSFEEGDHYPYPSPFGFTLVDGESRGDGMVNFCLGSSAKWSCGSSIHHGRIPQLGEIKVGSLQELVENTK